MINNKLDIVNFQEQIHSVYINAKEQQQTDLNDKIAEIIKDILPNIISNEKEGKKVEKLQNDIQSIQDQVENVLEIEKRMLRLTKDFDINTIIKLIQQVTLF